MQGELQFNFEDTIGYIVNRAALQLKLIILHTFKSAGYDITPEQWAILYMLKKDNGLYQKQLADKLLKDKPNITRILDLLEKRELVMRKSDMDDRRKFKVYLTEQGKELIEKLIPIAETLKEKICKQLSDHETEQLKSLLRKLSKNLNHFCENR